MQRLERIAEETVRVATSEHLGPGFHGTFADAVAGLEQSLRHSTLPEKVAQRATELGATHVLYLGDVQSHAGRGTSGDNVEGAAEVHVLFLNPHNTQSAQSH